VVAFGQGLQHTVHGVAGVEDAEETRLVCQ
jgi:hypothetical protein